MLLVKSFSKSLGESSTAQGSHFSPVGQPSCGRPPVKDEGGAFPFSDELVAVSLGKEAPSFFISSPSDFCFFLLLQKLQKYLIADRYTPAFFLSFFLSGS